MGSQSPILGVSEVLGESVDKPRLSVRELKTEIQHNNMPQHAHVSSSNPDHQARNPPECSSAPLASQHAFGGDYEESRIGGSLGGSGGNPTIVMEGGGPPSSFARVGGGEGHPTYPRFQQDQPSAVGHSAERSREEERSPPHVLPRGTEHARGCQHDHGPDQQEGHGQDPTGEYTSFHRSGGLRGACKFDLWRTAADPAAIQFLGFENRSRRPAQPTAGSSSPLDREHQGHQSREDGDPSSSTTPAEEQDSWQGDVDGAGLPPRDSVSGQCSLVNNINPNDDASSGHDDSDGRGGGCREVLEGGSRVPQGGEAPEEDRQAREDRLRVQCPELSSVSLEVSNLDPSAQGETQFEVAPGTSTQRPLSESMSHFFEHQSANLASQTFQSLLSHDRAVLVEVACSPESRLSDEVTKRFAYDGAAIRCSHWNGCDLGTSEGVQHVLKVLRTKKPSNVWISTECGPYWSKLPSSRKNDGLF